MGSGKIIIKGQASIECARCDEKREFGWASARVNVIYVFRDYGWHNRWDGWICPKCHAEEIQDGA